MSGTHARRRRVAAALYAVGLSLVTIAAPRGVAAASILVDPGFDDFAFRAPLDADRPAARSGPDNCAGGVEGQTACFRFPGWYPFVAASPGRPLGRVERPDGTSRAELALPGGGEPIGNFASLSQSPVLEANRTYRVSAMVRPAADNDNPAPYVSVFCDRADGSLTVYQGTDTALQRGDRSTGIVFRVAGDGERWTCSVRLLGQPGAGGREGVLTSIAVPRFDVEAVGRVDAPSVRARASRDGDFEGLAADLSDSAWQVTRVGSANPSARIDDDGVDATLALSLASGDDGSSVTVSQPLRLERGGRYRLCAEVTNRDRARPALANVLVSRPLPIPGNRGGFVTGPVDVALEPGQTRRVAVPFVSPTSGRDYRLVVRALGYGNAGPVSLAFDDVRVVGTASCGDA